MSLGTNEGRKDIQRGGGKSAVVLEKYLKATAKVHQDLSSHKRAACEPLAALLGIRSERSTREVRKRVSDVMLEVQDIV